MEDINLVPPGIVTLLLILVGALTLLSRVNLSINSHLQRVMRNLTLFKRVGISPNSVTHLMFILVSYMWIFSLIISYLYRFPMSDSWSMAWLVLNLGVSIFLSLPLSLFTLYLFKDRDNNVEPEKIEDTIEKLSGRVCHVTSNVVNERIGEAKVSEEGEPLKVRCQPGEILHKGDVALIVEFDEQLNLFWIEAYSDPLA